MNLNSDKDNLLKKIARLENMHRGNNAPRAAWALLLRYYQLYRLTGDAAALERAAHLSHNYYAINFHFIWAYFLNIYIELEQGSTAKAQFMLEKLRPMRGSIKSRPLTHSAYLFLSAAIDLKRGKARASRRQVTALVNLNRDSKDMQQSHYIEAFISAYYILSHEREQSLNYLISSLNKGADGAFLQILIADLLVKEKYSGEEAAPIIAAYLRFALTHGLISGLSGVTERNRPTVLFLVLKDKEIGYRLYDRLEQDWLLDEIVRRQVDESDYSLTAHKYYCIAEAKQQIFPGLATALVTSARMNNIFNASRYTLERFFTEKLEKSAETVMFACYLAVSLDSNTSHLAPSFFVRMMEGGADSPYLPALCMMFLLTIDETDERYFAYRAKAAEIVGNAVFVYDVIADNLAARHIWVCEKEKAHCKFYEMGMDGALRKAVVTASGSDFGYVLFDEGMQNIVAANVTVRAKTGAEPSADFCMELFNKGRISPELLIYLSKHCMEQEEITPQMLGLLHKTEAHREISGSFRSLVRAALGEYHSGQGNYAEAVKCYEATPRGLLDPKGLESMLLSYVNSNMPERAVDIIGKRPVIPDKALFYILRKIASDKKFLQSGRKHLKDIAAAAYELSVSSWYDKNLVAIALEHAHASQREWQGLSRALVALSAPSDILDENILNNAIWTCRFDPGAQKVFASLYKRAPDNPYIMAFALFAAFEIIVNKARPEYETIETLEKIVKVSQDGTAVDIRFLHYALSHIYIDCNIATAQAVSVLRKSMSYCETDGIIFPIFKSIKDKSLLTPYIEKNQAFIHWGGKGKRVKILYKSIGAGSGSAEYTEKNMQYIRFGLYAVNIPVFYGEKLAYMISEETDTGSIVTKEAEIENNVMRLAENNGDLYYIINNAIIYESMFKYEAVEEIITDYLKEVPRTKGWLM